MSTCIHKHWLNEVLSSRPIILCYHRISESKALDINQLSVSPENFKSQLEYLLQKRKFVTLQEIFETPSLNTIAITFDDGYRDNYKVAANILTDFNIPASFFLATRFIEHSVNYYPSTFNTLWNFHKDQKLIPQNILGSIIEKILLKEANYFKALRELSAHRPELLWELTQILDATQRDLGHVDELECPMSVSEVTSLASSDLFSIGPHTATHPRMSSIPLEEAMSDFAESVTTVAKWGGSKPMYFPYPFGQKSDFNSLLEAEINSSMNLRGLSTFPIAISPRNTNALTLPRLSVQNWGIDKFRFIVNMANAFSYAPMAAIFALKASASIRNLKDL